MPTILEVVCRTTRTRFALVARVAEERWAACSVLDEIDFGLKPGGELKIDTTIWHQIRQNRERRGNSVHVPHADDLILCRVENS